MYTRNFDEFNVQATGQTATTTISTSTGNTLPNTSAGTKPRFVRFSATGTCYVRMGVGAQTAVNTDMMVQAGAPVILAVAGSTNWAAIDDGVSVKVNVTPLENS
jgi:hypothetical protein